MTRRLYLAAVLALVGGLLLAAGAPGQPAAPALTAIEPDTFIDSGPTGTTSSSTATFTFHSDDLLATGFECSLDGATFSTCSSPSSYSGLADGSHTFDVRAINVLSEPDSTPAHAAWTIDTVAPETTITSPPIGTTSSTSATFTFISSEPGSTFKCRRNGHKILPCSSPKTYSALANGTHTFRVWATDPSGNEDATPASQTWKIDSVAPQTTLTSGPTGTTSSTSATFTFSSSEPGSTFECRRNLDAFSACASPITYSALADGTYTFAVRATDPSGITDPSPATATWTVASSSTGVPPVGDLRAVAGDHRVRLIWTNPTGIGLRRIEIRRGSTQLLVYSGRGTEFIDTRIFNGRTYRYSVAVFDDLSRRSPAAGVFALPHGKLVAPRDGTRVLGAPLLRWLPRARATYYNVQLYRNGKKILSRWPAGPRFQLRRQWRYQGRLYRLRDARYLWYVFPGFGAKTASRYGNVMGHSTFFKR